VHALAHRRDLDANFSHVEIVLGDVRDPASIRRLVVNVDIVVSTLGSADATVPDVCSTAILNLIRAMRDQGIVRVLATTGSAALLDAEIGSEHPSLRERRAMLMPHMAPFNPRRRGANADAR
jgi:putative NADH-flavin reductase